MGTSNSYGGPGNRSALLPPWADGDSSPTPQPTGPNPPEAGEPSPNPTSPAPAIPQTLPNGNNWATTSRHFGSFTRGGGGGSLGKALRSYTRSKGGARQASISARSGRRSTARLGGFLSNVATGGVRVATEKLGLEATIIGMPIDLALGAIIDVIAPDGATPDDNAARLAIIATLDEIYDRFELEAGDLTKLEAIDADTAKELIVYSVTNYLYEKFLQDLEYCFEEENIPEDEVIRLEREVQPFIEDRVKVELLQQQVNVLNLDWTGAEGQRFCEDIYSQAYTLLEGWQ